MTSPPHRFRLSLLQFLPLSFHSAPLFSFLLKRRFEVTLHLLFLLETFPELHFWLPLPRALASSSHNHSPTAEKPPSTCLVQAKLSKADFSKQLCQSMRLFLPQLQPLEREASAVLLGARPLALVAGSRPGSVSCGMRHVKLLYMASKMPSAEERLQCPRQVPPLQFPHGAEEGS